jgi:predicted SAM-dependent methyltransferase
MVADSWPQLHDRTSKTPFDSHYFWMGGWAMRRILSQRPSRHVDVGSQVMFINLLSAVIPVTFIDYRPLEIQIEGLVCRSGNILDLPFEGQSIESLSCLSVAEHIGLGRYGDPLNPEGTRHACAELQRVLAPGGSLYLAVPVGLPRLCFNAHRIHTPQTIVQYFPDLELVELSGVHDDSRYVQHVSIDEFAHSRYACGMFHFRRPPNRN